MGDRGFNAGGFAYMKWIHCAKCGRKFPIGRRNTRTVCSNEADCQKRAARKAAKGS